MAEIIEIFGIAECLHPEDPTEWRMDSLHATVTEHRITVAERVSWLNNRLWVPRSEENLIARSPEEAIDLARRLTWNHAETIKRQIRQAEQHIEELKVKAANIEKFAAIYAAAMAGKDRESNDAA